MPASWAARTRALRSSGCPYADSTANGIGRVVAPRAVAGELEGRHQLDGADAQLAQVAEASAHPLERARPAVHALAEGAHVQLVDDQVVPGGRLELARRPSRRPPGRTPRRCRRSWSAGAPADRCARAPRPPARTRNRYSSPARAPATSADQVPPSSGASGHARGVPVAEGAGHRDTLGVGRPDPEGDTAIEGHGTHAGTGRGDGL